MKVIVLMLYEKAIIGRALGTGNPPTIDNILPDKSMTIFEVRASAGIIGITQTETYSSYLGNRRESKI